MKDLWYYLPSVPFYLLMMGIEQWVMSRRGEVTYNFADTITNVNCGLGQQAMSVATTALAFALYHWGYEHHAFFHYAAGSMVPWVIAFVGLDFSYYWYHRSSHRVNVLWAMHNVHHQSEYLNFGVALRQPWFTDITGIMFYWTFPLLGVPIFPFLMASSFLALYQVWLHTRMVGKFERAGLIFNTPSFHRVHHGRDARYLNHNFGATLIIWDRMFGTFKAEQTEPRYGLTEAYDSLNPVWAQLHYFFKLTARARQFDRAWDKLKLWVMPPEWSPAGIAYARVDTESEPRVRFQRETPRVLKYYIFVQYALIMVATFTVVGAAGFMAWTHTMVAGVLSVLTVVNLGGLLEAKRWTPASEVSRLVLFCVAATWVALSLGGLKLAVGGAVYALISLAWFLSLLWGESAVTVAMGERHGS